MTASIPIPFAIGQQLWAISNGHIETWTTCPECEGTKVLTLVKGNGEIIELNCNYCAPGMDSPRGVVTHRTYDCQPVSFVPQRVEMIGQTFRYSEQSPDATAYQSFAASDLFEDREACAAACVTRTAEYQANAERGELANLQSKRKNLEHSSHYWTSKLHSLERDIEITRRFITVIKKGKRTARAQAKGDVS